MKDTFPSRPTITESDAERIAQELYGVAASARELPSEHDRNFYLRTDGGTDLVLKIANRAADPALLHLQNRMMGHLVAHGLGASIPNLRAALSGQPIEITSGGDGTEHMVRMLTYVTGEPLACIKHPTDELFESLGRLLGKIDTALEDFSDPAAARQYQWDLKRAPETIDKRIGLLTAPDQRAMVAHFMSLYESRVAPHLASLRTAVIHNDANDYNVLVGAVPGIVPGATTRRVTGILDFGDALHSQVVNEPAVAIAYVMLDKTDPIAAAAAVVGGYHVVHPLTELEIELLFLLACTRLCLSVSICADQKQREPDNEYLRISERPAWALLHRLREVDPDVACFMFRRACGLEASPHYHPGGKTVPELMAARAHLIGPSLSISYERPLKIVRGYMQHLYDADGREYLDAVNNVPHVGHCHPHVVAAATRQLAVLNTNTRYLHDGLIEYAQRLTAKLPEPLGVCFFVCSGSEANELALRLARAHTGGTDFIVVEGAYHGNTSSLIEISPYKFDGPGGEGAPPHVQKVPIPDCYRGLYRDRAPDVGERYAAHVRDAARNIADSGRRLAAFICEPAMGCAGQIILPPGYLEGGYRHVREAGGVCIADEVQVGFGRVGTHFWAFETQGVVPDIVTLGKPIGNGHPLAAVITTPTIAASFDTGMEYFNTFGGNPVSCAVGMAVLDVIEDEQLQSRANETGTYLKAQLERLQNRYEAVGDVRGLGLFIGVELVRDRQQRTPATDYTAYVAEKMKDDGVLVSTDGPSGNVIKIKPPLVFTKDDADRLVATLDRILYDGT